MDFFARPRRRVGGVLSFGYGVSVQSARAFATMVQKVHSTAEPVWIRAEQLHRIQGAGGVLYLADPMLTPSARLRLRVGPAHYCLCGVTHTTASAQTMEQIAELLTEPVMPWDALICTSTAVAETVRIVLEAQAEFLRWRLGDAIRLSKSEIPVIPLGVHCSDFAFSDEDRHLARIALGIQREDVAALTWGGSHLAARLTRSKCIRAFRRPRREPGGGSS